MKRNCKLQIENCKLQIELRKRIDRSSQPNFQFSIFNFQFAIAFLILTLLSLGKSSQAEDKLPAVRHIFVPVDNPKEWPKMAVMSLLVLVQ